jgi:uncharacterized membrane protein (DUF485 family)
MNADRVGDLLAWRRACSGPAFVALKVGRFRLVRALLIIYLASYLGLALLCGFARQLTGVIVLGPLNLGYTLIIGNYMVAWVLALVYLGKSGRRYDVLAAAAIEEHVTSLPGATVLTP